MPVSRKTLDIIYTLCATARFNSERAGIVNRLIVKVIEQNIEDVDIKASLDKIKREIDERFYREKPLTWLFELQQEVVFSKISVANVNELVLKMYLPLALYCGDVGVRISVLVSVCNSIATVCDTHMKTRNFDNSVMYQFENRNEYVNLSFVKVPDQNYIDIFAKCITFSKTEIFKDFESIRYKLNVQTDPEMIKQMQDYITDALESLSIPEQNSQNLKVDIEANPILKIDSETYVLVGSYYLYRTLLHKCELLLKDYRFYRERKGKVFESIVLDLFQKTYGENFHPNIKYNNNEVDGLLNLNTSSWFIECSSHPPDMHTGFSDATSLFEDFRKSVIKCQDQGVRAIDNSNGEAIRSFRPKDKKGIIVIIDEHYPNISEPQYKYFENVWRSEGRELPEQLKNPIPKTVYPKYVINYFELEGILAQPDAKLFEEFLIWRTQDSMPIACSDELDYWDYFTKMYGDKEREQIFKMCQEKHNIIHYIGNRFNDKSYLERIMENETREHGS